MPIARANPPEPWVVGVTDLQKARAHELLDAGNALFLDKNYPAALEKYREAVASWDHPAIRFNIVRCLIQLDRAPEAAENLALALKYGSAPLEESVYREALAYDKLLAKQVGDLAVACDEAGAVLTLDGQPLATCPARESRRVAPGRHQILGTKDGFVAKTVDVIVVGGEAQRVTVELMPLAKAARIEHRWPAWMPWVVFGGGLAVAGVGGLLEAQAFSKIRDYDRQIAINCPDGCPAGSVGADPSAKRSAERENDLAIAVLVTGIAGAATGSVLLYLNRGRTVYPSEHRTQVGVTPLAGGAAITLGGSF
jgi:tetratricopeptide (TPR) repeat protein